MIIQDLDNITNCSRRPLRYKQRDSRPPGCRSHAITETAQHSSTLTDLTVSEATPMFCSRIGFLSYRSMPQLRVIKTVILIWLLGK